MLFTSCYVLLLVTTLIVNCILGICIKYIIYPYLIQNIARMFDCEHFVYTYASLMHVCVLMYYAIFCWWCIRMRNCKNSIVSDWISFRLCRLLVIDHARSVLHIYTHTHTHEQLLFRIRIHCLVSFRKKTKTKKKHNYLVYWTNIELLV